MSPGRCAGANSGSTQASGGLCSWPFVPFSFPRTAFPGAIRSAAAEARAIPSQTHGMGDPTPTSPRARQLYRLPFATGNDSALSHLHPARGWRSRSCPTCQAMPGGACRAHGGRGAVEPHAARRRPGQLEMFDEKVWMELERRELIEAVVPFSTHPGRAGEPGRWLSARTQPHRHSPHHQTARTPRRNNRSD